MRIKIKYKKNPHQQIFHEDISTKFLHLSGGFGSGKTYGLLMKGLQLSFLNRPFPGGLVIPSFKEYKRDILPIMEQVLADAGVPIGLQTRYHKTDNWFQFPWSKGKLEVATAQARIRGPNWAYAIINELTLIPIETYRETIGRVRIKNAPNPQIASCGTAEGYASEYYEVFILKPWQGMRVVFGRTRDNAENLSADYIKSIEDSYDSTMLAAYLEGEFVNMTGNRFYYAYTPKINDNPNIVESQGEVVHVFMDFNVDPMVASLWHLREPDSLKGRLTRKLQCFGEIVLNDADTNKMCRAMMARGITPDRAIIYPDPAGQSRSTKGQPDTVILKNHGYLDIRVRSSAPGMRQRQLNVNNLLEKGIIEINPDLAPVMKRDLMAVEQDKVTLEKIKKNPKLTHASDGLDYGCDILFPFSGKKPTSSIVRIR